ncbi:hypothetical protein MTO96_036618, partial [Rhipicephalus appendiculatus]
LWPLGGGRRAEYEDPNIAAERVSIPTKSEVAETAEEDIENVDGATDTKNVCDEAAPGVDENVSGDECAEVVEEKTARTAKMRPMSPGSPKSKLVGKLQHGHEEAGGVSGS